jgi:cyclic-di-GMP phosphodiesterase TipF (flagellum assembly factor)
MSRRLAAVESRVEGAVNKARGAVDPIAAEIGELGGLVRQIADTVASHAAALQQQGALPAAAGPPPAAATDADGALTLSESDAVDGRRFRNLSREGIVELIGKAVDAHRIDLYLQPIVTLPQRKVRYYEALSRLRTDEGDIVTAADFIDYAESVGLMPKIDNLLLFRCVQVTRRLQLKSRDIGLFCNVSASTLSDPVFFRQFLDFMDANRALSNALMFEFTQSAYRALGPLEHESLAALHGSCHRPAPGAEGIGRSLVLLPESAGQAAAQSRRRIAERHPSRRSHRSAGALGHRPHRRAHRS